MRQRKRIGKHIWTGILFLLISTMLILSLPAEAAGQNLDTEILNADSKNAPKSKKAKIKKWVKKDGYYYYYNEKGRKVTGLHKIGKKKYLFDKNGRQQHGWQTVKGSYYFFRRDAGKMGYMVKSATVNHVRLKKNGKADMNHTSYTRMYCLQSASRIVETYTRPLWSKAAKMRAVWYYFQSSVVYGGDPSFSLEGDWGARYAGNCFAQRRASCEGLGFAWAFLADACGAGSCYCVCSGGHGWAEVEGLVYDPSWDRVDKRHNYYGQSKSVSGVDGIPNYAAYGIYRSGV